MCAPCVTVGVAVTEYRKEGVMMREWQAPACGILFCIMAVGNFQATSATVLHKRNFAKKARMR